MLLSTARNVIHLAYLFDPYLAVHTSLVEPLPHQITAVYGEMLPRHPRRLASSPEAIYQSLRRRRERLQKRLQAEREDKRRPEAWLDPLVGLTAISEEEWDDLEDAPDSEVEATEEQVVDQAIAAQTIAELEAEIASLERLEALALQVRRSGADRKWDELSRLLQDRPEIFDAAGQRRKLVIFKGLQVRQVSLGTSD